MHLSIYLSLPTASLLIEVIESTFMVITFGLPFFIFNECFVEGIQGYGLV
jgi:hypothetical protein